MTYNHKFNFYFDSRYQLFSEKHLRDEQLPPTDHTFDLHVNRCNYQAYIWMHANEQHINPPSPTRHGWYERSDGSLAIQFMIQSSAPKDLLELTTCKCSTSQCRSNICSCRKKNLICTDACSCKRNDCCNDKEEDVTNNNSDDEG